MTPATAAEILGVDVAATPAEIETAYRRLSRASHPDRFAGAPDSQLKIAAGEFVRITDARSALLSARNVPAPPPYEGYDATSPRLGLAPRSWWIFGAWTVFLIVGLVVSAFNYQPPASVWDISLRLVPIGVTSVAFALTGRRGWFIAMVILAAASVGLTIATASFGPLVAIELLLIPMLGLAAVGRGRMRANRAKIA